MPSSWRIVTSDPPHGEVFGEMLERCHENSKKRFRYHKRYFKKCKVVGARATSNLYEADLAPMENTGNSVEVFGTT